ncbi:MAG: hypothetical protein HOB14_07165 [Gammaproteobacteria bacterium]|nr:hypothetical protein [Gammaproteobacteria bacterium]MBT6701425.1 hypothetical protein [Gammaproteobacteria bacterium]
MTQRRSASETLWIHLLMHIGFTKPLLSEVPLRLNSQSFGKRSIARAAETVSQELAHNSFDWPTKPVSRIPSRGITSNDQLIEVSILAASMYYLYEEKIYQGLTMNEVIQAFDLYTNIRELAENESIQISPDNAYWISREFYNHYSTVPYCEKCGVHYYSSIEQKIKNGCPFCKRSGIGENNGMYDETALNKISLAKKNKYKLNIR